MIKSIALGNNINSILITSWGAMYLSITYISHLLSTTPYISNIFFGTCRERRAKGVSRRVEVLVGSFQVKEQT